MVADKKSRIDQFSIKHLFIWTTVVGLLVGIGRMVPWPAIAELILQKGFAKDVGRSLLMTLLVVATAWTVLGNLRTSWIRLIVLLVFLVSVSYGLVMIDQRKAGGWSRTLAGWGLNADELRRIWFTWTSLSSLFLAGLFLLFRLSGHQLVRIARIKGESA